jgi:hypothetical protein
MKKMMIIALALAFHSGITAMARAQTPSISSVGDYDGSTPTQNDYYWSIYGSNLSNRTGGPGVSSSIVTAYYIISDGYDIFEPSFQESGTDNTPTYWYESPSQINFYFYSSGGYGYDPILMQEEYFYLAGDASVEVTNSNNLTSSPYGLTYQ